MLNADRAPYFETCPRCGDGGFERLSTHSHCVGCNYSEEFNADALGAIPPWVTEALKSCRAQPIRLRAEKGELVPVEELAG